MFEVNIYLVVILCCLYELNSLFGNLGLDLQFFFFVLVLVFGNSNSFLSIFDL